MLPCKLIALPCSTPAETVVPPEYVLAPESVSVPAPSFPRLPVPATTKFVIVTGPLWTENIWFGLAPLTESPLTPAPLIVTVALALFSEGSGLPSRIVEPAGKLNVMLCAPAPAALAWFTAHRNVPGNPVSAVLVTWKVAASALATGEVIASNSTPNRTRT